MVALNTIDQSYLRLVHSNEPLITSPKACTRSPVSFFWNGVLQWHGHPRVLGIPIPWTLVIWASPSHITLAIWVSVRVTGDTHITRVLGMGMPKTRSCPYHCVLNFTNMIRIAARDSMWTIAHFHPFCYVVILFWSYFCVCRVEQASM